MGRLKIKRNLELCYLLCHEHERSSLWKIELRSLDDTKRKFFITGSTSWDKINCLELTHERMSVVSV